MTAVLVTECGLCGSDRLESVLSLGSSPPTCVMVPVEARQAGEYHYPLELLRCHDCTLVQLSVVIDPEVVFPPEYPYSSGNSQGLHRNFEDLARQADSYVGGLLPADLVVDIGANDGTLLSKFTCRTVGVEPTGQARKIDGTAYQKFFTEELAYRIREQHGPAKVVTACNVLAHVPDIDEVMRGVKVLLADDGVFIAENHDLQSVVDGQWDTVYHEHLRFYDPHSFRALLNRYGIEARTVDNIPTHGGSFRTIAQKGLQWSTAGGVPRDYDLEALAENAADARSAIRCTALEHPGIWAIGATARATTIINYCGLDVEDISHVCEVKGSDKIGHYIPGTRIPVVDEAELFEKQPAEVLLFSWHLADVIVPKLREKGYDGEIIVPLPTLQTV